MHIVRTVFARAGVPIVSETWARSTRHGERCGLYSHTGSCLTVAGPGSSVLAADIVANGRITHASADDLGHERRVSSASPLPRRPA